MIQQMFISDYFDLYDKVIRITNEQSLCLKRLSDNTVVVSLDDELSGTLTKLAAYSNGRWKGYNAPNLELMMSLFRKHKHLKPKLIKFLTPNHGAPEIKYFSKAFTCARRRFVIKIKKTVPKKLRDYDKMDL